MLAIGYLIMCIIFGTTFMVIKIGLQHGIPPLYMASLRFFIASILLLGFLWIKKSSFPKSYRVYGEIVYIGILMTAIPFASLFWAEQHIHSGIASLLVASAPVFIGVLSKMDKTQWIGFLAALLGILLIVLPDLGHSDTSLESTLSKLAILMSEFCFAYGSIRSKKILATDISPNMFNGLQMIFASFVLLLSSFVFEQPLHTHWDVISISSLLYLAIVASILSSGIYYWLVKMTNPLFPSTWTYVAPILAMLFGTIFLRETISPLGIYGSILIIGGVIVVNRNIFFSLLTPMFQKREQV